MHIVLKLLLFEFFNLGLFSRSVRLQKNCRKRTSFLDLFKIRRTSKNHPYARSSFETFVGLMRFSLIQLCKEKTSNNYSDRIMQTTTFNFCTKKFSPTGNRTPAYRVTGGDTYHSTIEPNFGEVPMFDCSLMN